ncbi:P-loop containing nucleoside triphosphate hydrolase protein [Suillus fuscotomentosus]|uniref:P-loop containing nucleoside triphosphate hydrolase protein n=1 Tax=Suillus fuscotomentosus TaxID=1912939 RepID=A0AAD4DVS9_9AGAM|nr:P-loop containing nucleoside triphosphate hydrolase protein [Suillus fuscotomentosus]KAG1894466.1 P-loop containing nucleoside triphosphate hydrolase protein [Suillus fuscotomentosus]
MKLGLTPCTWQLQSAHNQLENKDVFTISPTGSGKTLTFWIPLLFNNGGITIIITPLNILSEKNQDEANAYGFPTLDICAETATDKAFKDIEKLKYRVLVVSPERVLQDARFKKLWKCQTFTDNLFSIAFDEGHCISEWGKDFRPLYSELGNLRWYLPAHVRFHAVSATMPPHILLDVQSKLRIRSYNFAKVVRSNDCANIHFMVQEMKYPQNTYYDLGRILPLKEGTPPEKFMLFINAQDQAEAVCNSLCKDLPAHLRHNIGEIWGICCTDAAGMGLDLRDVRLVNQWGYIDSLCILMQHLGRAARDHALTALAVYFVEPLYFDTYSGKRKWPELDEGQHHTKKKKVTNVDAESTVVHDEENSQCRTDGGTLNGGDNDGRTDGVSMVVDQRNRHTIPEVAGTSTPMRILPVNADSDVIERAAMVSHICCDVCNKMELHSRLFPLQQITSTRAKPKYKIKPYKMTDTECRLQQELIKWRDSKIIEEDLDADDFFGPQMIMSNKILNCIVDLAHYHKILSTTSLFEQTSWCYSSEYGQSVLDIILTCIPLPIVQPPAPPAVIIPPPLGLSSSTNQQPTASTSATKGVMLPSKRSRKCRACGSTDHIGTHCSLCPLSYRTHCSSQRPTNFVQDIFPSPASQDLI